MSSELSTDQQIIVTIATSVLEFEAVLFPTVGKRFIYFSCTAIKNSSKLRSGLCEHAGESASMEKRALLHTATNGLHSADWTFPDCRWLRKKQHPNCNWKGRVICFTWSWLCQEDSILFCLKNACLLICLLDCLIIKDWE